MNEIDQLATSEKRGRFRSFLSRFVMSNSKKFCLGASYVCVALDYFIIHLFAFVYATRIIRLCSTVDAAARAIIVVLPVASVFYLVRYWRLSSDTLKAVCLSLPVLWLNKWIVLLIASQLWGRAVAERLGFWL